MMLDKVKVEDTMAKQASKQASKQAIYNCILVGDCIEQMRTLPDEIVDCCVTSPPYYGLRDYGNDGQIGLEESPEKYIERLVDVFREVKRVLKKDGTLWLNIADSYWGSGSRGYDFTGKWTEASAIQSGSKGTENLTNLPQLKGNKGTYKNKDMIGIPWMLALALRADGWYLRQDIIWHKPNPMPESVRDRCTRSHEYIFLLSKSRKYYFDGNAISEPIAKSSWQRLRQDVANQSGSTRGVGKTNGNMKAAAGKYYARRNKRDVWIVTTQPTKEAHFATYPQKLIEPCILAGSRAGGIVLDPFFGSGTTGIVAMKFGRQYIGCELNPEYVEIAKRRTQSVQMEFT